MANFYVSSAGWTAVTAWAASQAVTAGTLRRQAATPAAYAERVWVCTTAGTTGTTEPAWNLTKGSTTTDNGVVWTEVTGQEAYQAPGAWAAPHASAIAGSAWLGQGDTLFVASGHNKSVAATGTATLGNGNNSSVTTPHALICVDETATGHVPPLEGDIRSTAVETITSAQALTFTGWWSEINGITFTAGSGSTGNTINISDGAGHEARFRNSAIRLGGTGSGIINVNASGTSAKVTLANTTFQFGATNQRCEISGPVEWRDTPVAVTGTVAPPTLFTWFGQRPGSARFENIGFPSILSSSILFGSGTGGSFASLSRCRLPSGMTISTPATGAGAAIVEIVNTDLGANFVRHERYTFCGTQTTETTLVRTGGASDGTTPHSWKVVTTTGTPIEPFETMPMQVYASAGSRTVTLEGIWNAATLPTQDDLYLDVRYLNSASTTLGARMSGAKLSRISTAANLTASTQAWDSLVAARANSTAYTVGAMIKTASNPGRVFFCTAAGTSASSEPAGYASAVDGGTVTDGTATFRAGVRFNQTLSFTMAVSGVVTASVRVGRASATFWTDPALTQT